MKKMEFIQLQNWMRQRGLSTLGIQTGPFAAIWAHFILKDFQLFHFHTGKPILITPEVWYEENGIRPTSKFDETERIEYLGHSNWTICSQLSPFYSKRYSTFSLSYWEANSYYPRGLIWRKGNSSNFKIGYKRGGWVPWQFKLDHIQRFEPILS